MGYIKELLMKRKITQKITFIVFFFTLFPTIIFFVFLLHNVQKNAVNDQIGQLKTTINQDYSHLQKIIELCNMSTQVFLNSPNLLRYLERVKSGEKISITDSMEFYRDDISSLEQLVNGNPYLYQIRVYADNKEMQEMMPILYRTERLRRLSWGKEVIESGTWHYDFNDSLFPKHVRAYEEHIMSLTTLIPDHSHGRLGIIEVAIHMETAFPKLFDTNERSWSCFIDNITREQYYNKSKKNRWNPYVSTLLSKVNNKSKKDQIIVTKIAGEEVIIASKTINELDGRLVKVVSLKKIIHNVNVFRNLACLLLIITLELLIIVINIIVKTGSKRFYDVLKTLHIVQNGNLDVEVPYCGTDEIGELSEQINIMLKKIKQLVKDNIDREVLVKNSEIRALQNQINAHFIYNVLESVKMMAEVNEQYDISDAITSLGKMLRYSMKGLSKNVTVEQEIDYIKDYINLMNLRFDYEIYLSLNIPEELWQEEIPKMSLQPIVENAISHGIEQLAEDTNIYIKGIVKKEEFIIEVTDQGKGMTDEELGLLHRRIEEDIETSGGSGNGIGLKNVQDRIRIHFGEQYGIDISSMLGCYTKVSIRIPRNRRV
ncbi:sensor histidine kinase [Anaeromicropila herbilytica]|uniref:histidine kinase n=1 Tax=Anaeromicropila herbilytica TaxID=2785025 RepID=A0A7R7IDY1_9FIRM|nr:histidine kinase [Anaeromicropila herbilytica]BCN32193.1 hypothetical protein bsdtb5_34880 [Anaeromicropila herbilytica]